jgi:hypothetical protein
MSEIPGWHITGDWFDNCSCAVVCPCTFAQAPDNGFIAHALLRHRLCCDCHFDAIGSEAGTPSVSVQRYSPQLVFGRILAYRP